MSRSAASATGPGSVMAAENLGNAVNGVKAQISSADHFYPIADISGSPIAQAVESFAQSGRRLPAVQFDRLPMKRMIVNDTTDIANEFSRKGSLETQSQGTGWRR